jgi:hypothetical protein
MILLKKSFHLHLENYRHIGLSPAPDRGIRVGPDTGQRSSPPGNWRSDGAMAMWVGRWGQVEVKLACLLKCPKTLFLTLDKKGWMNDNNISGEN